MTAKSSASRSSPRRGTVGRPLAFVDSNVWLLVARRRFPLEREVERLHPEFRIAVPGPVLRELERLEARGAEGARVARELASRHLLVPGPGEGDPAILRLARLRNATVVTADASFRKELRAAGVPLLVPRGTSRLEEIRARRRPRALAPRGPPEFGKR